jgi:hypothetical protein
MFNPQLKLPFLFKDTNKNRGSPLKPPFFENLFEVRRNLFLYRRKTFCSVVLVFVRIIQALRVRSIDGEREQD